MYICIQYNIVANKNPLSVKIVYVKGLKLPIHESVCLSDLAPHATNEVGGG